MPGLIQSSAPTDAKAMPTKGGDATAPSAVMAAMHLTPQQKPQLERIVAAGKKVMYDESTHQMMLEQMQSDGPVEQRLSMGIVALISILWKESNNSLPPQLVIPAAMVLLAEAADFMKQAGEQITPEQFGKANELLIDELLKQGGVSSDKLAERVGGVAPAAPAGPSAAPGAMP